MKNKSTVLCRSQKGHSEIGQITKFGGEMLLKVKVLENIAFENIDFKDA